MVDINERYIENTEEYERALSALLMPEGKRISEIAESKYTSVSEDTLRKVAKYLMEEHILLLYSDGEKSNPRIYRNNVMTLFKIVWRHYTICGPDALFDRLDKRKEDRSVYVQETDYNSPQELLKAIKNGSKDLSYIQTDKLYNSDDTGELFWDVYVPWSNVLNEIRYLKIAIKLSDEIESELNCMDIDVVGQYGDFSNINAVASKLGLENQPPDDSTLNNDGTLID